MELNRGTETINYPCTLWTDENGVTWGNPQLAFLYKRGFVEAVALPPPPPTPEEEAARKKELIRAISNAARDYIEEQANAALQDQLYRNVASSTPHPMAVEVMQWGSAIALEAENRKGQVMAGIADDQIALCDFSSFGEKPYTVYQLYTAGVIQFF